jgi:hypothetical protein
MEAGLLTAPGQQIYPYKQFAAGQQLWPQQFPGVQQL